MTRKDIIDAYARIRTIDNTIPDDVLDFMKEAAIQKLEAPIKDVKRSLIIMTSLCRLKYGNLDEDVYKEIVAAEKLITTIIDE